MQFIGSFPVLILYVSSLVYVKCDFSISGLYNSVASTFSELNYEKITCKYYECCNEEYINYDIDKLDKMLTEDLYGQEIAQHVIINALRGHINVKEPPKALSISFHGTPGTGKNYVAQMIAKSIYKKGTNSQYYHFFNGRNDFPLEAELVTYKERLRETIESSLAQCERSMFVFDEVDKMPEGLLDVLVPFLDYNTWHKSWRYSSSATVPKQKAIYIFLSNTGSNAIVRRMISLWGEGKSRKDIKLQDFEHLIAVGAFNEKGGFHRSDTIENSVIDHYVPFLPLEEVHVKLCLQQIFQKRQFEPTIEMIEEVMSHVIFGPQPHNLYSSAGCKRLEQKVATVIYRSKKQNSEL